MIATQTFEGRTRKPWYKKINPYWWCLNDDNQTVDQAPWYHPEWSYRRRWWTWNFIRNPMQNFRSFVIGVQDRNYTVTGKAPICVQRDDLQPPELGYQWSVIHLLIPRPFVSYSGKRVVWYIGWQPNGFFGGKWNMREQTLTSQQRP